MWIGETVHRTELTPARKFYPGQKNDAHDPLVPKKNIYLPLSHYKLWLMKQFVKATDKTGEAFPLWETTYPRLIDAKNKEGVFVGLQIWQFFYCRRLLNTSIKKKNELSSHSTRCVRTFWETSNVMIMSFMSKNCSQSKLPWAETCRCMACRFFSLRHKWTYKFK